MLLSAWDRRTQKVTHLVLFAEVNEGGNGHGKGGRGMVGDTRTGSRGREGATDVGRSGGRDAGVNRRRETWRTRHDIWWWSSACVVRDCRRQDCCFSRSRSLPSLLHNANTRSSCPRPRSQGFPLCPVCSRRRRSGNRSLRLVDRLEYAGNALTGAAGADGVRR